MVEIRSLRSQTPTVKIRALTGTHGAPRGPYAYNPRPKPVVKQRKVRSKTKQVRRRRTIQVVRRRMDFPAPTPQPTPCVLWQGIVDRQGYGRMKAGPPGKRYPIGVHRWVMQQLLGRRLRPDEVVMHRCDQPLCYRAEHLSVGTVRANNADMKAKKRNSPPPRNVFHGENHPRSLLSAEQVVELRQLFDIGWRREMLARRYGISRGQVSKIINYTAWKEPQDE